MDQINQDFLQLKEKISRYNPGCDLSTLDRAYALAKDAHSGQVRLSGEPYITHPLAVAHILADIELDCGAIIAALLHDTVEDTAYSSENITERFGTEISLLVDGVTKLDKIPYSTKEEQQLDNFRKMFFAMAKDIRVILIKLADRLHNMRTMKSMPEEKQRGIARETMEVYAPLAHRLGMQKIKWELEDLSLRYLDPIAYQEISNHIALKRLEREEYLESVKTVLKTKLDELSIKVHIEGRAKHFYSIYRKMYTNNITIDEIYDLLAVRVIVDTISECYAVLGLVHELFKPIPGRFKDYIAMPKKNMYQSLHTTLIGPGGKPFEIQIRTWGMHRIAEVGIAAHWKYKEGVSGTSDLDSKLEWVRQLLELNKDMTDAEEFMSSLKIDLFEDEVFVFSPKGAVINLPVGSCPIDFAYAIHSAIGSKTTGAKINGKIVPLDHQLTNGDIVEIITSSVPHGPSRDWLKIVKTNQARKKINEWFKKENRDENIARGKDALEKELKRGGIPPAFLNEKGVIEPLCKRYNLTSLEDLYAAIGFGGLPVAKAMTRIREEHKARMPSVPPEEQTVQTKPRSKNSDYGIVVSGLENCLIRLSKCCSPLPGDEIVGYITRGRGVSVHRSDCLNAVNLAKSAETDGGRFIDVWWEGTDKSSYIADIRVVALDRKGLAVDIMNVISNLKLSLTSINARASKDGLGIIHVGIEISNTDQLDKAFKNLWKVKGVTSVDRTKQ